MSDVLQELSEIKQNLDFLLQTHRTKIHKDTWRDLGLASQNLEAAIDREKTK